MDYNKAKDWIIARLVKDLDPILTYHNIDHTIDVLSSATQIAKSENITGDQLLILQTAALYHDSGMLRLYKGHEMKSIEIVKEILPTMNYSDEAISKICEMILTTELPQNAKTIDEMILCDADLDYLGRDDFFWIGQSLRLEWNRLNINKTTLLEWYELQIKFMESHNYFTPTAQKTRNKGKLKNIEQVYQLLGKTKVIDII